MYFFFLNIIMSLVLFYNKYLYLFLVIFNQAG